MKKLFYESFMKNCVLPKLYQKNFVLSVGETESYDYT